MAIEIAIEAKIRAPMLYTPSFSTKLLRFGVVVAKLASGGSFECWMKSLGFPYLSRDTLMLSFPMTLLYFMLMAND